MREEVEVEVEVEMEMRPGLPFSAPASALGSLYNNEILQTEL